MNIIEQQHREAGFNDEQIAIIQKGIEAKIPLDQLYLYDDIKLSAEQMDVIFQGIQDGLTTEQLEMFASPDMSVSQMNEIKEGLLQEIDMEKISMYAVPTYTASQMNVMRRGLDYGLNNEQIQIIANPEISSEHMETLMQGLRQGMKMSEAAILSHPNLQLAEVQAYSNALIKHSVGVEEVAYVMLQDSDSTNKLLVFQSLTHGVALDDMKKELPSNWASMEFEDLQQQINSIEASYMPQQEFLRKQLESSEIGDSFEVYIYSYSLEDNQVIETPYTASVETNKLYEPYMQVPTLEYYDMDGNRVFPFIDSIPHQPVANLDHVMCYLTPSMDEATAHFKDCIECCIESANNQISEIQSQIQTLEVALDEIEMTMDDGIGGL